MSESILDHGYIPEEHAPDPVTSHGDPTPPGKVATWLFLASEIMFFIGILGSYIILRSSAPHLFSKHAEALSKPLAGVNTLVLIFSSLTMALSVDAAQKGDRKRLITFLAITLACAAGFLGIKYVEYSDKWFHRTMLVKTDAPVTIKADPGQALYTTVVGPGRRLFNTKTGEFEKKTDSNWAGYAVELKEDASAPGTYRGTVPAGAAGRTGKDFAVYQKASVDPAPKDKQVKVPAEAVDYDRGVWVYDGHVHPEPDGSYKFHGERAPYAAVAKQIQGGDFDLHLVSEADVRAAAASLTHATGGKDTGHEAEHHEEITIPKESITAEINYGPWKNVFYSSYFALTGVHGVHVVGGMIPIGLLLIQAIRGKVFPAHTEYTGLYWHFVDLVWIFLFPLLYLI